MYPADSADRTAHQVGPSPRDDIKCEGTRGRCQTTIERHVTPRSLEQMTSDIPEVLEVRLSRGYHAVGAVEQGLRKRDHLS